MRLIVILLSINLLGPVVALAVDFGKKAHSFEIKEQSFIEMIQERLSQIDLASHQAKMQDIARKRILNPPPVERVKVAKEDREFYYDPSYTVKRDIILPCGKLLHAAGTRVNPLEHMKLERRLYFIDGREEEQIDWLKLELNEISNESGLMQERIILVGGSPLELQEKLGVAIYFDQNGELTGRMGIKASPAIAEQEGLKIKVRELALGR